MTGAFASDAADVAQGKAQRVRALVTVAQARLANSWLRLGASAVVAIVATSIVGNYWPLVWLAGLALVIVGDRAVFARALRHCETHKEPPPMRGVVAWVIAQSIYGNIIGALLYFAPYVPGETLAVFFLCGALANAAATLRSSRAFALAGAGPTVAFMLGMPIVKYLLDGQNALALMPMVGALLLLGFGVNLWRSLVASDEAQAQAEQAVLRERQTAAAAAAAKSDTIQRMNDEMRTPMLALIGAAEHLRRAAATPQARSQIATLVQAGEVLKLVLDDLSDLDRLENGSLRIEPRPADPRDIARSVVSAFRSAAEDKHLELFLDVAATTPQLAAFDALRVRQVLFNLLANAVRFTVSGGVRVRLGAQAADAGRVRLVFQVADTGCGMSQAQLATIFGRERVSAHGAGPGLGIAISRRLARLMGGHLTARSAPGDGSVFSFSFEAPLVEARAASAAQEPRQLAR